MFKNLTLIPIKWSSIEASVELWTQGCPVGSKMAPEFYLMFKYKVM